MSAVETLGNSLIDFPYGVQTMNLTNRRGWEKRSARSEFYLFLILGQCQFILILNLSILNFGAEFTEQLRARVKGRVQIYQYP